ncbi:MAG: hypothetical protein Q4C70_11690, partial [Planctomycetia bacterium]|nr:hypothetical protein [Planctomycetia bacterium]
FVEEDLYSPKKVYGESPSIETKLRIFVEPGGELDSTRAFELAMEWLKKNPVEKITSFQRLTGVQVAAVEGSDGTVFDVTLSHTKWRRKTTIFQMDTGGETARRYFGIPVSAAGRIEKPGIYPNFYGGIAFQGGEFQGIDIPVPGCTFSITACYPWEFMTAEWMNILTLYRGCSNAGQFYYWATDEVRFEGASIQMEEEINPKGQRVFFWRITFNFKASPTMTGLTNNGTLGPIDKAGFDAYWIYTVATAQPEGQGIVQKPIAHYTVKVAESVDFSALCIPDFRLQAEG